MTTSQRRCTRLTCAALAFATLGAAQQPQPRVLRRDTMKTNRNALISREGAYMGVYVLGEPVARYEGYLRPSNCHIAAAEPEEKCWESSDGSFWVGVVRGAVRAVRTTSPEMFTDRFIRPQRTMMREVVEQYGVPERIERDGRIALFVYEPLRFEASNGPSAEAILNMPVLAVILRQPRADPRVQEKSSGRVQRMRALAEICYTARGSCPLPRPAPVGTPCSCPVKGGETQGWAK